MKTFSIPKLDSVRAEFGKCCQAGVAHVGISKAANRHVYGLKVGGVGVGLLLGREAAVGGDFAFVPDYDPDQEVRLKSLALLVWYLPDGDGVEEAIECLHAANEWEAVAD
jgi:hypothetical protein